MTRENEAPPFEGLALMAVWMPLRRAVLIHFDGQHIEMAEADAQALVGAIGGALATRDHGDDLVRLHAAGFGEGETAA